MSVQCRWKWAACECMPCVTRGNSMGFPPTCGTDAYMSLYLHRIAQFVTVKVRDILTIFYKNCQKWLVFAFKYSLHHINKFFDILRSLILESLKKARICRLKILILSSFSYRLVEEGINILLTYWLEFAKKFFFFLKSIGSVMQLT